MRRKSNTIIELYYLQNNVMAKNNNDRIISLFVIILIMNISREFVISSLIVSLSN